MNIDLSALGSVDNPFEAMLFLISHGGWVLLVFSVVYGIWIGWLEYARNVYDSKIAYALLAIDIPKNNEQSPKAVEHIFAHLSAIQKRGTLYERYIEGFTVPNFSLEIVSIEGYIQFLIRTPVKFRDLVEAAIYAQYPDAEITEVEDYIDTVPKPLEYPNKEFDLWGTELKLTSKDVYPIKTYPFFEHALSQTFLDPMASFLEILSRFGPGEQLWFQVVISPADSHWRERGIATIRKLIGKKSEGGRGPDLLYFPRVVSRGLAESFTAGLIPPTEEGATHQKQDREWPSLMQHLSPDERSIVESVGIKISKLAFVSKIRIIYVARKEVFKSTKASDGVTGALRQFNTLDLNGFAVDKKTRSKVHYINVRRRLLWRKRRILWGYRYRSLKRGRNKYVLNTEELATLFHFPVLTVRAPFVQRAETKKAQPPSRLPLESTFTSMHPAAPSTSVPQVEQKGAPPANLPVA